VLPSTVGALRGRAHAAIVGSALHVDGQIGAPLCLSRARALVAAAG